MSRRHVRPGHRHPRRRAARNAFADTALSATARARDSVEKIYEQAFEVTLRRANGLLGCDRFGMPGERVITSEVYLRVDASVDLYNNMQEATDEATRPWGQ